VALVSARPGKGPQPGGPPPSGPRPGGPGRGGHGNKGQWVSELCANETLAESFLTQTRELITTLESNGSYSNVLADRAQEITYIQSATNAALLSTNCTGFFSGLNNARSLDSQAQQQQQAYQRTAGRLFWQIIQSLVGGNEQSSEE
jgi:hypothetical protein